MTVMSELDTARLVCDDMKKMFTVSELLGPSTFLDTHHDNLKKFKSFKQRPQCGRWISRETSPYYIFS